MTWRYPRRIEVNPICPVRRSQGTVSRGLPFSSCQRPTVGVAVLRVRARCTPHVHTRLAVASAYPGARRAHLPCCAIAPVIAIAPWRTGARWPMRNGCGKTPAQVAIPFEKFIINSGWRPISASPSGRKFFGTLTSVTESLPSTFRVRSWPPMRQGIRGAE
jgi:hypothetical protein